MSPPRYFSLVQATELLPEVEQILRHLREERSQARGIKERVDGLWQRLETGGPVLDEIATTQARLDGHLREMETLAGRLEEIGCVLRDVEMGLIDFPALAGGTEFYLCWRLGEDGIQCWHGTDEGYPGRKPLWTMPGGRPRLA